MPDLNPLLVARLEKAVRACRPAALHQRRPSREGLPRKPLLAAMPPPFTYL